MRRADILREGERRLAQAGVEAPNREAGLLLQAAGGGTRLDQIAFAEMPLAAPIVDLYRAMLTRRAAREPLSHILGRREFFSREFQVSAAVLDPRPDSETLIEAALFYGRAGALASGPVLDLGTGSGCLLLTLLAEWPEARGMGLDCSPAALKIAAANAASLNLADRVAWRLADWRDPAWSGAIAAGGPFAMILANPPYIPTGDIAALDAEVRDHEPYLALDGGEDGLAAYRALAPALPRLLAENGRLLLEIGLGQGASVAALFQAAGFVEIARHPDLAGRDRCLAFTLA